MTMQALPVLAVVLCSLLPCSEARECLGVQNGTCGFAGEPVEDVGLLQARRAKAGEASGTCKVGDAVQCPGSSARCAGRQCCPDFEHHSSFPCPSAPHGWGSCGASQKKVDCTAGGGGPSPPGPGPAPPSPPPVSDRYHPHFDTTPDYLGISARAAGVEGNPGKLSDNFYLVVSDGGGCNGGCGSCCATQRKVAEKMRNYVRARKARDPNAELLFVLAGGDNFYWNGARSGRFHGTWLDVYGPELTSVPWFAVMGNHDYGNDDPTVGCPNVRSRFTCDSENAHTPACGGDAPYSTERQGYNSNAFNADKHGVDGDARKNWHQPDYTYFYSIPKLNFELIAMDWNVEQFGAMGGNGFCNHCGAHRLVEHCGSQNTLYKEMSKVRDASTEVMSNRTRAAQSRNVAILSHYPDGFQRGINFRDLYLQGLPEEKRDTTKVFNFYGHTHVQHCDKKSASGECTDFLTGAAGGCCSRGDLPAGFASIAWDDEGTQVVDCFLGRECTLHRFSILPDFNASKGSEAENLEEVCAHTADDTRCEHEK